MGSEGIITSETDIYFDSFQMFEAPEDSPSNQINYTYWFLTEITYQGSNKYSFLLCLNRFSGAPFK